MSNFTENPNIEDGGETDPLVDSLLRQFAGTQGNADEDFLAQVEKAIDDSDKIVPIAQTPKWKKSLAWASGIAAVIATSLGIWFTQVPYEKTVENSNLLLVEKGPYPELYGCPGPKRNYVHQVSGSSTSAMGSIDDSFTFNGFSSFPSIPFEDIRVAPEKNLSIVQGVYDESSIVLRGAEVPSGAIKFGINESKIESISDFLDITQSNFKIEGESAFARSATSIASLAPVYGNINVSGGIDTSKLGTLTLNGSTNSNSGYAQLGYGGYDSDASKKADNNVISTGTGIDESVIRITSGPRIADSRDRRFALNGHGGRGFQSRDSGVKELDSASVDKKLTSDSESKTGDAIDDQSGVANLGKVTVTSAASTAGKPAAVMAGTKINLAARSRRGERIVGQDGLNAGDFGYNTKLRTEIGRAPKPGGSGSTRYGSLIDNAWMSPLKEPLSTFSIDVDTASWTNVRGMIRSGITAGQIPDDAVRIEEMINYFDWDYPQPKGGHPFAFAVEDAACPWNADNRLLRVGIQGLEMPKRKRPDANLVFLLDVSGSMNQPNKLPLVKKAISILVEELDENDRVTMVVYAGAEGVALPPTSGRNQAAISASLRKLDAGGSTNGGAGIKLAYKLAAEQFIKDGINRVILCTDGDFNVGQTGDEQLVNLIERKAKSGVFLSVCGFGQDNLNDSMLEKITNKGNGNYFFVDTPREARKVFLKDMMGTLLTIAKDVKIQMEFNPAKIAAYRLIGYANRRLNAEDFENDKIDAGEVGSGHSVTALYEVIPVGSENDPRSKVTSNLRYQKEVAPPKPEPKRELVPSDELALLKLRYKRPDGDTSILVEQPIKPSGKNFEKASKDYQFASAVALFGMILREHESVADQTISDVLKLAENGVGNDPHGYRVEFVKVVRKLIEKK